MLEFMLPFFLRRNLVVQSKVERIDKKQSRKSFLKNLLQNILEYNREIDIRDVLRLQVSLYF